MKTLPVRYFQTLSLGLLLVLASSMGAAEHAVKPEAKVTASIRPKGKFKPAELPSLAHVTFTDACKVALVAAPGNILKGELEIEDGNLMYSFEIVGADKRMTEVEVDAGNGNVLDVDRN